MDERVLNELLECSVCLDRMDTTSKVLPCQHTFCRRCLEEIMATKNELRCPECRSLVEIKVDELPPNILLIRLLEGMKVANAPPSSSTNTPYNAASSSNNRLLPSQQSVSQRINPSNQPSAKALYNYEAKEPGDLSFKKGDVILLKKQVDENWFHGELNGQCGFFPISYVQVVNKLPSPTPRCKALFDFEIDENEKDCLKFQKDEVLTVIRRVDDNWAEGKHGDRIGIFPIAFVEMNEAAKSLVTSQAGTLSNAEGSTSVPKAQKRHSLTSLSPQHQSSLATQQQRHSTELGNSVSFTPGIVDTSSSSPPTSGSRIGSVQNGCSSGPSSPRLGAMAPTPTQQDSYKNLYMSLYNYKPLKDDELELCKNAYYEVTEKCQDGWFKGMCTKTYKVGVFPGNYVQPAKHGDVRNIRATGNGSSAPLPGTEYQVNKPQAEQNQTGSRNQNSPNQSVKRTQSVSHQASSTRIPVSGTNSSANRPTPARSTSISGNQMTNHVTRTMSVPMSSVNTVPPGGVLVKQPSSRAPNMEKKNATKASKTTANMTTAAAQKQHTPANSSGQALNTNSTTPPNVVIGATGPKDTPGATGPAPPIPARLKEKKDKEKVGLQFMKRLTSGKIKKSKSPPPNSDSPVPGDSPVIGHTRSGSLPLVDIDLPAEGATAAPIPSHQKSGSLDSSTPPQRPKPKPLVRERYRCTVPYPPNSDVELELKVGDVVYVHKKRDDGWFKGTLSRTGKTGLFPGSFVQDF